MENVTQILTLVNDIIEKYEKEERENGERFSYFSVLKIERAEVKHSAFIGELLNPKGLHGQGNTFLKLFLELEKVQYPEFQPINTKVEIEKDLGKELRPYDKNEKIGRTDIFLTNKTHCIVIENKIDAKEQPKQLARYHSYCKEKFENNFKILYLTLDGDTAKDAGNLENGKDYFCISYQDDILNWLDKCLQKCFEKPVLYHAIQQYINVIKKINNIISSKSMEQIHSIIKNNLKSAKSISEEYDKVLTAISDELRSDVLKALNNIYPKLDIKVGDYIRSKWSASSIWIGNLGKDVKVGIESFNTKSIIEDNSLFIGKFITLDGTNWSWTNTQTIMSNEMLFEKLVEYSCNENREQIVSSVITEIRKYLSEHYSEDILQSDINFLWRTNPDFRWNNGGKEIYEKMQNDLEFMQSEEYKKHMEDLKKEEI